MTSTLRPEADGASPRRVHARPLIAVLVGGCGIAAIMFVSSTIESVMDRPGGALMACLLLIIAVTLIGGPWVGYLAGRGVASGRRPTTWRDPMHSFSVDDDGRAHPARRLPGGGDRHLHPGRPPGRRSRRGGGRPAADGRPAAPDGLALARAHRSGRLRGRADGGARGARRERGARRDSRRPTAPRSSSARRSASPQRSRTAGSGSRRTSTRRSATRSGTASRSSSTRASSPVATRSMQHVAPPRPRRCRSGRTDRCSARSDSASRDGPPLHRRPAGVRDRARRALRARARARAPVRRRTTRTRGARHTRDHRRAPRPLARSRCRAAHARGARRAGGRRPVRRRPRARRPDRAPGARARRSGDAGRRHARSSSSLPGSPATRRSRSRSARARRSSCPSRAICPTARTTTRRTGSPSSRSSSGRC